MASRPFEASETNPHAPWVARNAAIPLRNTAWSSKVNIRIESVSPFTFLPPRRSTGARKGTLRKRSSLEWSARPPYRNRVGSKRTASLLPGQRVHGDRATHGARAAHLPSELPDQSPCRRPRRATETAVDHGGFPLRFAAPG